MRRLSIFIILVCLSVPALAINFEGRVYKLKADGTRVPAVGFAVKFCRGAGANTGGGECATIQGQTDAAGYYRTYNISNQATTYHMFVWNWLDPSWGSENQPIASFYEPVGPPPAYDSFLTVYVSPKDISPRPSKPKAINPTNGATGVPYSYVSLQWTDGLNFESRGPMYSVTYDIYASEGGAFPSWLIYADVPCNPVQSEVCSLTVSNLLPYTNYTWRVEAKLNTNINNQIYRAMSDVFSFQTRSSRQRPVGQ